MADTMDISVIHDEDVLRKLWQQTEDFGQKKEIRTRMYKLREQRLKEFYTTGEVLSDVQTVTPITSDEETYRKAPSYTTSTGKFTTHTDSLPDHGFLSLKSKEIRDSESPTRDFSFFRGAPTTWAVETSSSAYKEEDIDGQVNIQTKSNHSTMSGENEKVLTSTSIAAEGEKRIERGSELNALADVAQLGSLTKIGSTHQSTQQRSVVQSSKESSSSSAFKSSASSVQQYQSGSTTDVSAKQSQSTSVSVAAKQTSCATQEGAETSSQSVSYSPEKTQTFTTTRIGPNGEKITETRTVASSSMKQSQQASVSQKWSSSSTSSSSQATSTSAKSETSSIQQSSVSDKGSDQIRAITERPIADSSVQNTERALLNTSSQNTSSQSNKSTLSQDQHSTLSQTRVQSEQLIQNEAKAIAATVRETGLEAKNESQNLQSATSLSENLQRADTLNQQSATVNVTDKVQTTSQSVKKAQTNQDIKNNEINVRKEFESISSLNSTTVAENSQRNSDITQSSSAPKKISNTEIDTKINLKSATVDSENWKLVSSTASGEKKEFIYQDLTEKDIQPVKVVTAPVVQAPKPEPLPAYEPVGNLPKRSDDIPNKQSPPVRGGPTPQELGKLEGDVDYTTTYNSAFTPKRISMDVSASHAQFASSLRAPSLSPERSSSPTKQHFNTPADRRSPTKSMSRNSLDRHSPTKSLDRRSPSKSLDSTNRRSKSPTKSPGAPSGDRRSPNKSPDRPRDVSGSPRKSIDRSYPSKPHERVSPTKPVEINNYPSANITPAKKPYNERKSSLSNIKKKSTDETNKITTNNTGRRKLSSHSTRTATKKRSGTPRVSPSPSPVDDGKPERQSRPRSRGSSSSSTSIVSEDESTPKELANGVKPSNDSNLHDVTSFLQMERQQTAEERESLLRKTTSGKLREKSPEYSSDGSLIQELYPNKKRPSSIGSSPSSSPERKGFLPIKEDVPTPDYPSPNTAAQAPAPSPASPIKRLNGTFTDSDADTVAPNEKPKPIKPISTRPQSPGPRKSSSSRSSSISPYSSPERGSPRRGHPVSSSASSSPDRKSPAKAPKSSLAKKPKDATPTSRKSPERKKPVTPGKKSELTEYPAQRRFPDKVKPVVTKVPSATRIPSKSTPTTTPIKKPIAAKSQVPLKAVEKKTTPVTPKKTVNTVHTTNVRTTSAQRILTTRTSSKSITSDTHQKKPAVPKFTPVKQASPKTPAVTPVKKTPLKPQNSVAQPTKPITIRSAFARSDSREKKAPQKAPVSKPGVPKQSSIGTFEDEVSYNRTNEYVSSLNNKTQRDILEFEFDSETPPNDFLVDNSSTSSLENVAPVKAVTKKPIQHRTSSGPVNGSKPKANAPKNLKTQRSEPKIQVSRKDSKSSITKKTTDTKTSSVSTKKLQESVAFIRAETVREVIESDQETDQTVGVKINNKLTTTHLSQPSPADFSKSSRESSRSPDSRPVKFQPVSDSEVEELRPRYADRVSEPDDDSDIDLRRRATRPSPRPEVVVEEEEEPLDLGRKRQPVTDLDETTEDEEGMANVSVADRVNLFINSARQSASSPLPTRPEDITLKGLDDTINAYMDADTLIESQSCVGRAKTMFETIASNQTVVKTSQQFEKETDIINRSLVSNRTENTEESDVRRSSLTSDKIVTSSDFIRNEATRETVLQQETNSSDERDDVEEILTRPIGKIDVDKFTPKTPEPVRKETVKIGKINTERFESKTNKTTDTFRKSKASSPERKMPNFELPPLKRAPSTDTPRDSGDSVRKSSRNEPNRSSPTKDLSKRVSPTRSSPTRDAPNRVSQKVSSPSRGSPTRELPQSVSPIRRSPARESPTRETPKSAASRKSPSRSSPERISSIKTETTEVRRSILNRYPFASPVEQPKREIIRPTKSNAVAGRYPVAADDFKPQRKDTPAPVNASPVKLRPVSKPLEPVTVSKPKIIPEDSTLKTPALLRKTPTEELQRNVDRSPPRKPSVSDDTIRKSSVTSITRRDSTSRQSPTRSVPSSSSPTRRDSGPGTSPNRRDSSPRLSPTRRDSGPLPSSNRRDSGTILHPTQRESPNRRDSLTKKESLAEVAESVDKSTKFGVLLRKTSSGIFNRRLSEDVGKKETELDRIFDIELLEQMLEKAVGYEQRRLIRGQIRIAKKAADSKDQVRRTSNTEFLTRVQQQSKPQAPELLNRPQQPRQQAPDLLNRQPSRERSTSPSKNSEPSRRSASPVKQPTKSRSPSPKKSVESIRQSSRTEFEVSTTVHSGSRVVQSHEVTDSVTSSYGVGPTDDKGRPLFGLRALRRQDTDTDSQQTVSRTTTEQTTSREVTDSAGRPLFGLKALKTSAQSSTMPSLEQPATSHLKDLVSRHESNTSKGNTVSSPRQRPSARLRNSFIEEDAPQPQAAPVEPPSRGTLKAMIQRHESLTEADKKSGSTTSKSTMRATVVRQSAVTRADGSVDVKKQVLKGEAVSKDGKAPVGHVTKTDYEYNVPIGSLDKRQPITSSTQSSSLHSRNESLQQRKDSVESQSNVSTSRRTFEDRRDSQSASTRRESVDSKTGRRDSQDSRTSDRRRSSTEMYTATTTTVTRRLASQDLQSTNRTSSPDFPSERRSSTPLDDIKDALLRKSSVTEENESHTSSLTRGGSVRALSQRYLSQTANAVETKPSGSYPKAGLIFRTSSFQHPSPGSNEGETASQNSVLTSRLDSQSRSETKPQGNTISSRLDSHNRSETKSHSSSVSSRLDSQDRSETKSTSETKSFVGSSSRVTGVQDVLARMRAADQETTSGDTAEDAEARSLLNKFLGASVMMSGMEPLVPSASSSSALVSQVERQRILNSSKERNVSAPAGPQDYSSENIETIWDERRLRQLLDSCSDYDGRRQIRSRLRTVMAERSVTEDVVALARAEEDGSKAESTEKHGESLLLPYLVEHLRTSLMLESSDVPHVEDSGTESGEDLRLLAGLKGARKKEPLGPGLLAEVQSALNKLQQSLSGSSSGGEGSELDPHTRETLLQLVARLQTSLKTPDPKPTSKSRFANRRLLRQNRHTVGVTREELADARRLLEETSLKDLVPVPSEPADMEESQIPYKVMKQSSAGDLMSPPVKAFKPVNFLPGKVGNNVAKPFTPVEPDFVEQPAEVRIFEKPSLKTAVSHSAESPPQKVKILSPPLKNIQYAATIMNPQVEAPSRDGSVEHEVESVASSGSLLDYDPSLRLFTPEQSVQIAVHQAAINKQLSREDDEKQSKMSESDLESTDDEVVENDGDVSSDDESTVINAKAKITPPREKQPSEQVTLASSFQKLSNNVNKLKKDTSRFERKLEEVQNDKRAGNRGNSRPIEELQRIHNERKEKENKSSLIQSAQAKYQKNLTNQAISRSLQPKPVVDEQRLDLSLTESERSSASTDSSISHAQKLLQLATNDKPVRFYGRSAKKLKMKRANTIDIPKPLNYYEVADDSDYSEEDGTGISGGGLSNLPGPPPLKPKTENDKKFLAFLGQHNPVTSGSAMWNKESQNHAVVAEHQWGNRFSRIKTAFEGPPDPPPRKERSVSIDARSFWKSADDTADIISPSKSNSRPKISRQGSIFLKKIQDQKSEEKPVIKPPWTQASGDENVVVGSLTVCPQRHDSDRRLFSPPTYPSPKTQPPQSPVINKFSHAPMSAFRPVGKSSTDRQKAASNFQMNPKSPTSPSLPWLKESPTNDKILNSALAKFESISLREESPITTQRLVRSPTYSTLIHTRTNAFPNPHTQGPPHATTNSSASKPIATITPQTHVKPNVIIPTTYSSAPVKPNAVIHSQNYSNTHAKPSVPISPQTSSRIQPSAFTPIAPKSSSAVQNNYSSTSAQIYQPNTFAAKANNPIPSPPILSAPNLVKNPVTTYSVDVAATTTVYPPPAFQQSIADDHVLDSPQEHVAVSRVMGGAQQQQAVTVKQKTMRREEEEGRTTAARSLSNMLQRFSATPPGPDSGDNSPPQVPHIKLSPGPPSVNGLSHSPCSSKSPSPARLPLIQTKTPSMDSIGAEENVLTSRLQIPLAPPRAGSLQDLSPNTSPSVSPSTLRKSESWHQFNSQPKPKRPQSLVLPDLPAPQRKTPTSLVKTKSSHTLMVPKQVDSTVQVKQRMVEKFLPTPKPPAKKPSSNPDLLELDDNLENVDEAFEALFNSVAGQRRHSEQALVKSVSTSAVRRSQSETITEKDGVVTKTQTQVSTKTSTFSSKSVTSSNKPVSPFAKFQQLDRQNSGPASPSSPRGTGPLFTFTDPKLSQSASTIKERLLYWVQIKTKNYKNIQIDNFSTSWANGLAFCALIHHFLPDAFDYDSLTPKERRKNFELAFNTAEEKADIAPLLDVEDMVAMRKPDWKCVFTYVQAIYRRFKDED